MWENVYTHRGLDIKIKSPAGPDELGYRIDHPDFEGETYDLIQLAIDAIDAGISGK